MTGNPFHARVVIVGKTRMGGGVCVGGLLESSGASVRLLPRGGHCHAPNTPFEVGDVWTMQLAVRPRLTPPHTEDHDEWDARRLESVKHYLTTFIRARGSPLSGEAGGLFDGSLRFRHSGSAYVSRHGQIPGRSTQFWILPSPLHHHAFDDAHVYRTHGGTFFSVKYVGLAEPVAVIPAGTVVRVSLARWWQNPQAPQEGETCALQLSGWFGIAADDEAEGVTGPGAAST